MELIFHEKQEGALCAQHCVNSLLQGEYFTAVDLASLATDLDHAEQRQLSSNESEREHVESITDEMFGNRARSSNMDDSGCFSSQVITKALEVWGLELIPYLHPNASNTRTNPGKEMAYICNMQRHWFTIRKIGSQWFNLNSLMEQPNLISDTYLHLFLDQLQKEGNTVFIVRGNLPACKANDFFTCHAVTASDTASARIRGQEVNTSDDEEQLMLQAALEMSLQTLD